MHLAVELMMGVSLAACVGLRAWMPMLMVGLLARAGYVGLNPHFAFLERTDLLIIFGMATLLEMLGDKVIAVDHFLDAVGTVIRPAAATVLASAMLTKTDPGMAVILGLIVGGGTALTVHGAKAALRTKVSVLAPGHGNAAVSVGEDLVVGVGVWTAAHAPIFAFGVALFVLAGSVWLIAQCVRHGRRLWSVLSRRKVGDPAQTPTGAGTC